MRESFGIWIDGVFDYGVSNGAVHVSVDGEPVCSTPIARFELGMRRAEAVLTAYHAREAEVHRLKFGS